ncbi:MAG TPA: DUF167 domain-containing protein [Patescibacteria group bacterium]|nr:DUF167 domain-containing protein [Patescibacteria group bacterium]
MTKIIKVKVIPKAKLNTVKETEDGLKVYLTKPAQKNKANKALVEILADYFKIKKSQITIQKGEKSRHKIIEID